MLEGKTIIELTDVKNNKKEIYEDKNLITNAVADLLSLNPSALMYPVQSKERKEKFEDEIFPIANKCYGGILLFEDKLQEDINKYIAPSNNKIVGYASNDVNKTDVAERGSLNLIESSLLENGYKFVWDFSTSQANGKFSAISLTHYRAGKSFYGNKCENDAFVLLNYSSKSSVDIDFLNGYVGMVESDIEKNMITSILPFEDNRLEIIKFKEPITSIGLNDIITINSPQKLEKITIKNIEKFYKEIYSYDKLKSAFFDGKDGFYYGFINENIGKDSILNKIKINKSDYSLEIYNWKLEGINLSKFGSYYEKYGVHSNISCYSALKNGYLYVPDNERKNIVKININNPVDIMKIPLYKDGNNSLYAVYTWGDYIYSNKFIIDSKDNLKIVNGVKYFECSANFIEVGPFRIGYYANDGKIVKKLYLHTPYLATINNLSSPILKTADKTMKITYILTEEE